MSLCDGDSQEASKVTLASRMDWWSRRLAGGAASKFRAYNTADLRSCTSAILTAFWTSPSLRPSTKYCKEIFLSQLLGDQRKPSWRAFLFRRHIPACFLRFSGVLFSSVDVRIPWSISGRTEDPEHYIRSFQFSRSVSRRVCNNSVASPLRDAAS
ncbi:hypothetical protein TNCV_2736421 [Trichonephila clavipes]|nr:hypothetical protein TNCV_2736421 [Trichonephila clavipes]